MADKKPPMLHSLELDERMRHGDVEATPKDKKLKMLLDALVGLSILLVVVALLGFVGIGFQLGTPELTYLLTIVAGILLGSGFIFNGIRWRALRGSHGRKILEKWKADLQLTIVSILALFTVGFILVVEVAALLVFIGAVDAGEAGIRFADNFVLFSAIILLVQIMAFVVREVNITSYQPHPRAVLASNILTPVAGVTMLLGLLLATGAPQSIGVLADIAVRQAIYILTLGIGLEFLAMRIRLRLPSVYSLFQNAIDRTRRANVELKEQMQKSAMRTYIIAFLFVAISMAFSGAVLTGGIQLASGRMRIALAIFYSGFAIIMAGLILLRVLQARHLNRKRLDELEDLTELVGQKRRTPQEIARMGIYAISFTLGGALVLAGILVFITAEEQITRETVTNDRGEDVQITNINRESMMGIPTTYGTDILILGIVVGAGPFGYFFNQERRRIEAIDEKFPDFLRDIAESARAGMTLPRALVSAAGGTYGALTDEIKQMAAQVEWGVDFGDALERFALRAKTPLIDRTVALVVEAQRAGGNVVDILTAASDDAREIKQIVSERSEQMKMYSVVVFIAFFVFIAVVLILSAQFIPAFREAVDAAAGESGGTTNVGGITLAPFDPEEFNTIFFHAAIVQAVGGALVGGVMTRGHPVAGFNSMFIMLAASWISFRVVLGAL